MLRFTLYSEERGELRAVHIDPAEVASVVETERRPAFGGWHQVAVITLRCGTEHVVEDGSRRAAQQIREGKAAAAAAQAW